MDYCVQDVEVERAIKRKLARFPMAASEQKLWEYDQRINDRGVRVDLQVVQTPLPLMRRTARSAASWPMRSRDWITSIH